MQWHINCRPVELQQAVSVHLANVAQSNTGESWEVFPKKHIFCMFQIFKELQSNQISYFLNLFQIYACCSLLLTITWMSVSSTWEDDVSLILPTEFWLFLRWPGYWITPSGGRGFREAETRFKKTKKEKKKILPLSIRSSPWMCASGEDSLDPPSLLWLDGGKRERREGQIIKVSLGRQEKRWSWQITFPSSFPSFPPIKWKSLGDWRSFFLTRSVFSLVGDVKQHVVFAHVLPPLCEEHHKLPSSSNLSWGTQNCFSFSFSFFKGCSEWETLLSTVAHAGLMRHAVLPTKCRTFH